MMQKTAYMPHIDGLRAIAITLVVIFHTGLNWVPGGFIGVDVFFVLSGFLITGQIFQQMSNGQFTFSGFYLRRFRRLLPAYIVVALVTFIVACFILLPKDLVYHTKLMGLAFLSIGNFYLANTTEGYFAQDTDEVALLHTWSLSVEEQFYLVWPIMLMLLLRHLKGKMLLFGIVVLYMVTLAFSEWHVTYHPTAAYYLLPARFFELSTGAVLALVMDQLPKLGTPKAVIVGVSGLGAVFFPAFFLHSGMQFPGFNAWPVCIGTALLIYSGYSKNTIADVLSCKPLVALGKISYSLYLWHWPIFVFIRYYYGNISMLHVLLGIVASVILSVATLYLVENTFRFRWKFSFSKTVVCMYLLPLMVFVMIVGVVDKWKGFPGRFGINQDIIEALEKKSTIYNEDCKDKKRELCRQVILLGDSHAAHFSSFVHALAVHQDKQIEIKIQTVWKGFCPPLFDVYRGSVDIHNGSKRYFREDECYQQVSSLYKNLADKNLTYVVMSGYWSMSELKPDYYFQKDNEILTKENHYIVLRKSLYQSIQKMLDANITPVIIKDNPAITKEQLKCAQKKIMFNAAGESCGVPVNYVLEQQKAVQAIFADVEKYFPRVIFIDPNKIMCNAKNCATVLDGIPLYRDQHHLTDMGAQFLGKKYLQLYGSPFVEI